MPRKKQPLSLYRLSVTYVAKMVAHGVTTVTRRDREDEATSICQYAAEIPEFVAEKYLKVVLGMLGDLTNMKYFPAALPTHFKSFKVDVRHLDTDLQVAFLSNLHVLVNSQHLFIVMQWFNVEGIPDSYSVINSVISSQTWHFPKLVSVDLRLSATPELVEKLASSCPNLKKLRFSLQKLQVSDMMSVCKCVCLNDLRIHCYLYKADLICLLDGLPRLHSLKVSREALINPIVETLTALSEVTECSKTYELKTFGKYLRCPGNMLELLCKYFPRLELVSVVWDQDLDSVVRFAHLKKLHVAGRKSYPPLEIPSECCSRLVKLSLCDVDLHGVFRRELGVAFPVLKKLELSECTRVDLSAIAVSCPNIECLALVNIVTVCPLGPKLSRESFVNLKHLRIQNWWKQPFSCYSAEHIIFALSSCKELKTLTLKEHETYHDNCYVSDEYVIDDDLLKRLLQQNPMEHLKCLLIGSQGITFDGLTTVMESLSNLVELELFGFKLDLSSSRTAWLQRQLYHFDMVQCCINGVDFQEKSLWDKFSACVV